MTPREYRDETRPEEREILREVFTDAILFFLNLGKPVYLERFGILQPRVEKKIKPIVYSTNLIHREEIGQQVTFEKNYDPYLARRYSESSLVEMSDLSKWGYARLPLDLQLKWTEQDVGRLFRGITASICEEVILEGRSTQLSKLGEFFSLHNRQGQSPKDWLAGASIHLESRIQNTLGAKIVRVVSRPTLENAWEPFEVLYGQPRWTGELDPEAVLREIGYELPSEAPRHLLDVCAFADRTEEDGKKGRLLFVTNQFSNIGNKTTPTEQFELVMQLHLESSDEEEIEEVFSSRNHHTLLSLGLLVMYSREHQALERLCRVVDTEEPLAYQKKTRLTGALVSSFEDMRLPQLLQTGSFRYLNVVGITHDEAQFAEECTPQRLYSLLRLRGYHQITSFHRPSALMRTEWRFQAPQQNGIHQKQLH